MRPIYLFVIPGVEMPMLVRLTGADIVDGSVVDHVVPFQYIVNVPALSFPNAIIFAEDPVAKVDPFPDIVHDAGVE